MDAGIDHLVLKIEPDAFVLATVVATAGNGPLFVDGAATGGPIHVHAVAVGGVGDHVGLAQFPLDNPFPHVLLGQGQRQLTANAFAEMDAVLTVNFGFALEFVLTDAKFLHGGGHALGQVLLAQLVGCFLLSGLNFLPIQQATLNQQLAQGLDGGAGLVHLGRVGVGPVVGVDQAADHIFVRTVCAVCWCVLVFHNHAIPNPIIKDSTQKVEIDLAILKGYPALSSRLLFLKQVADSSHGVLGEKPRQR